MVRHLTYGSTLVIDERRGADRGRLKGDSGEEGLAVRRLY